MEYLEKDSCASIQTAPDLLYHCPCGRAYRSYPALYTHLRNKHNGQAPGPIKKPALPPKKRGRPSLRPSAANSEAPAEVSQEIKPCPPEEESDGAVGEAGAQFLSALAKILKSLPKQTVNSGGLNQITAVLQMNVYLVTLKNSKNPLQIGPVLSEFLREVSLRVEWHHFSQVYTLLMLLVQFAIEQLNDRRIITEGSVDVLCDFINQFLEEGLPRMAADYSLSDLAVLAQEAVLLVFENFFGWLMAKQYTNYRIRLSVDLQRVVSAAS